jgi:hypothetical protein
VTAAARIAELQRIVERLGQRLAATHALMHAPNRSNAPDMIATSVADCELLTRLLRDLRDHIQQLSLFP